MTLVGEIKGNSSIPRVFRTILRRRGRIPWYDQFFVSAVVPLLVRSSPAAVSRPFRPPLAKSWPQLDSQTFCLPVISSRERISPASTPPNLSILTALYTTRIPLVRSTDVALPSRGFITGTHLAAMHVCEPFTPQFTHPTPAHRYPKLDFAAEAQRSNRLQLDAVSVMLFGRVHTVREGDVLLRDDGRVLANIVRIQRLRFLVCILASGTRMLSFLPRRPFGILTALRYPRSRSRLRCHCFGTTCRNTRTICMCGRVMKRRSHTQDQIIHDVVVILDSKPCNLTLIRDGAMEYTANCNGKGWRSLWKQNSPTDRSKSRRRRRRTYLDAENARNSTWGFPRIV
jgi:hypothetical protein